MTSFRDIFGEDERVSSSAPGRVNLLGEHTDYNDGCVLPAPIPQRTTVRIGPSADDWHHFYSHDLDARADCPRDAVTIDGFGVYVLGCIRVLERVAGPIPALNLTISSRVPMGAGLSSSAALEVATVRALCRYLHLALDGVAIARLAQQAEIAFAKVRCGIMDQVASSLGKPGHLLFLDTRTLDRRILPLPEGTELLVLDSGVSRRLASSAYNRRREECEEAARLLGVRALRDVEDPAMVETLPEPFSRRARHVVTENQRVLAAAAGADAKAFGDMMNASHSSLRDDFEVSSTPLDTLVTLLQEAKGCFGARLTGAGFGGACVALVQAGSACRVAGDVLARYRALGGSGSRLVPGPSGRA